MRLNSIFFAIIQLGLARSQQLCSQYGYKAIGRYEFNNNAWGQDSGTGAQCLTIDGVSNNTASWHVDWHWSGGQNHVKSYPWVGKQIPTKKLLSNISNLPTKATWTYTGEELRADVSYDLFTSSDPQHSTAKGDYELMIWLAKLGAIQPVGKNTGQVVVAGKKWNLWDGTIGSQRTFSFVTTAEKINSFDADIKEFFQYLDTHTAFSMDEQYLLTFQFGTEPFTGGPATFNVTSWSATI